MVPVWAPVAVSVGAKVALRVQEAAAAKEVVHPVAANSVLLLVTVSGMAAVVLFLTVKVLAALVVPCVTEPNAREVGVTVIGETPVPDKLSVRGLPVPAKATVMLPVWAAAAVGAKVAVMVQVEEASTEAPQVPPVTAKGAAVEMVSATAAVSLFRTVNVDAALVVPSPTEPKLWVVGVAVIGATPVPVTVADTGLPTPV
jgi:hypothetical protein